MNSGTLIGFCHEGFERELCIELAQALGNPSESPVSRPGFGRIHVPNLKSAWSAVMSSPQSFIFTRQIFLSCKPFSYRGVEDRVSLITETMLPQIEEACGSGQFSDLWPEVIDTNEGRQCSRFATGLSRSLANRLSRERRLPKGPGAKSLPRLHLLILPGETLTLAVTHPTFASPFPGGIPRLRALKDAPSRSAMKLEEAITTLLSATERQTLLAADMTAVDLGAAPGGWSFLLAHRGLAVTAVDRGALSFKHPSVEHCKEDAFHYVPPQPVDWLFCDVVDQPTKITSLMAKWLKNDLTGRAIFNLKLPMKQRFEWVETCLQELKKQVGPERAAALTVRCKHLYHDRQEVTVCALSEIDNL